MGGRSLKITPLVIALMAGTAAAAVKCDDGVQAATVRIQRSWWNRLWGDPQAKPPKGPETPGLPAGSPYRGGASALEKAAAEGALRLELESAAGSGKVVTLASKNRKFFYRGKLLNVDRQRGYLSFEPQGASKPITLDLAALEETVIVGSLPSELQGAVLEGPLMVLGHPYKISAIAEDGRLTLQSLADGKVSQVDLSGLGGTDFFIPSPSVLAERATPEGVAALMAKPSRYRCRMGPIKNRDDLSASFFERTREQKDLRFLKARDADLPHNADFTGYDLSGADLQHAQFNRAKLRLTYVNGAQARKATFHESDFFESFWVSSDLTEANLSSSTLLDSTWWDVNLSRADLRYVQGKGATFHRAKMEGARLEGINFAEAKFVDAEMKSLYAVRSRWTESMIASAVFDGSSLQGANFERAGLSKVSFKGCDLQKADFSGARFKAVDLTEANLEGAKLRGALFDKKTVFPDGFDPIAAGMVPLRD